MGEQVRADQAHHRGPIARRLDQAGAHDAGRFVGGWPLGCSSRASAQASQRTRCGPRQVKIIGLAVRLALLVRRRSRARAARRPARVDELLPAEARRRSRCGAPAHCGSPGTGRRSRARLAPRVVTLPSASTHSSLSGPRKQRPQARRDAERQIAQAQAHAALERDGGGALEAVLEQRQPRRQRHELRARRRRARVRRRTRDGAHAEAGQHLDRLRQMRRGRPGQHDLRGDRQVRVEAGADRAMRDLQRAGLTDQPVVRVLPCAVKRDVHPLHAGGAQALRHGGRSSPWPDVHRRRDSRAAGAASSAEQLAQHRCAGADLRRRSGTRRPPADGAGGVQDVAQRQLVAQRAASYRHGSTSAVATSDRRRSTRGCALLRGPPRGFRRSTACDNATMLTGRSTCRRRFLERMGQSGRFTMPAEGNADGRRRLPRADASALRPPQATPR